MKLPERSYNMTVPILFDDMNWFVTLSSYGRKRKMMKACSISGTQKDTNVKLLSFFISYFYSRVTIIMIQIAFQRKKERKQSTSFRMSKESFCDEYSSCFPQLQERLRSYVFIFLHHYLHNVVSLRTFLPFGDGNKFGPARRF